MGLRTVVERDDVVHVYKRNGAYLIVVTAEGSENWAGSDQYDCAGSLTAAERVARTMVAEITTGGFRWGAGDVGGVGAVGELCSR